MKNMYFRTKIVLSGLFLVLCSVVGWGYQLPAPPQTEPSFPTWQPPMPPAKGKTLLLPKPTRGYNIFSGEAEQWLIEYLTPKRTRLGDAQISTYLNQVAAHLRQFCPAPNRQFQIVVMRSSLPDAFCQGDGKLYITTGFLGMMVNEDELAAVLAHEIGHEVLQHIPKTLSRQLLWMTGTTKITSREQLNSALTRLAYKYSELQAAEFMEKLSGIGRMDEFKADQCAFATTYQAGYNPRALINILTRIEQYGTENYGGSEGEKFIKFWLGSHPPTSLRKTALQLERMFLKLPPKNAYHPSPAFEAMKARLELEQEKEDEDDSGTKGQEDKGSEGQEDKGKGISTRMGKNELFVLLLQRPCRAWASSWPSSVSFSHHGALVDTAPAGLKSLSWHV